MSQALPDMDSAAKVERFVDLFYQRLLADKALAPIFLDVAAVDLDVHLPHIKGYWRKLLLGETAYQRHTMNIHRSLHVKQALTPADFERWLSLFTRTVDDHFAGERADRARRVAAAIAANMQKSLLGSAL